MNRKFIKLFVVLLFLLNIFFASWYVLNGDIAFNSDIARDFHLLKEIEQKKLILIGPRSSIPGVYHGPLWLYINYPAYALGNGNPLAVGVNWIILIIIFSIIYYFIAKDLFGKRAGILFMLWSSLYMAYHAKGLFNPHGAMFLLPIFYYFFVKYIKTQQIKFLFLHALIGGFMVQFQVAIGGPFLILSFAYVFYRSIQNKGFKNLLGYLPVLIGLSTFLIFDLKYDFLITKSLLNHFSPSAGDPNHSMIFFVMDRIKLLLSSTEFVRFGPLNSNFFIFILFTLAFLLNLKKSKYKLEYLIFAFFYLGFFPISLLNKYQILYFYIFPIFPLVFLIFTALVSEKKNKLMWMLFFGMYLLNIFGLLNEIKISDNFIGNNQDSWKALHTISEDIFKQENNEFGYFVYAPDVFGYGAKYALIYSNSKSTITAFSFAKKPITYLIIEPPPPNNPHMKDIWWIENQVKITSQPAWEKEFDNGYKIQKYNLDENEVATPHDPNIDIGIHFR
ncbi:hypothetical protein ACFL1A_00540 [Patescibacteria group bacterium]